MAVVNPNSGPGEPPWWPDPRYVREIPRLKQHANVSMLGYVRIDYCKRDIAETYRDIAAYNDWADDLNHRGLSVGGIFFDETPNCHTDHAARYLESINRRVKTAVGISGQRLVSSALSWRKDTKRTDLTSRLQTVHNPGTMPDEKLNRVSRPDVTVVFEDSLARYRNCGVKEKEGVDRFGRSRCCIILHSVPILEMRPVVQEVKQRAQYVFVTDLRDSYYNRFGPSWIEFIDAIKGL